LLPRSLFHRRNPPVTVIGDYYNLVIGDWEVCAMQVGNVGIYREVMDTSGDLNTRADELLHALGERVPSAASAICLWDPLARRHLTLANHGYPTDVMQHFNNWFVHRDPLFKQMELTSSGALRWNDFPNYRTSHSVTQVFVPAGFDEGLSARLVTAGGTYAGTLHVNSDDRRYPRDDDVREINALRANVAALLDTTARPEMVAEFLAPGRPAWLVDEHGNLQPLRHDQPPLAAADTELFEVAARNVHSEHQFRWQSATGHWLLVRVIPATPRHRVALATGLVIVIPEAIPFGLTARELDVVTLIVRGLTTPQIAQTLMISAKTVGHHIEHILPKMQVQNRVACSAVAGRHGIISGHLHT